MKSSLKKRLSVLESVTADKFAGIDIDYLNGLEDYPDADWEVVDFDYCFTILRNIQSGQIQGVYNDRRTEDEYPEGADFAYL